MENMFVFVAYLCLAAFALVLGVFYFTGITGRLGIIATSSKVPDRRQRIGGGVFCLLFALNSVLNAFDVDYPLWLVVAQVVVVAGIVFYVWLMPSGGDGR